MLTGFVYVCDGACSDEARRATLAQQKTDARLEAMSSQVAGLSTQLAEIAQSLK